MSGHIFVILNNLTNQVQVCGCHCEELRKSIQCGHVQYKIIVERRLVRRLMECTFFVRPKAVWVNVYVQ